MYLSSSNTGVVGFRGSTQDTLTLVRAALAVPNRHCQGNIVENRNQEQLQTFSTDPNLLPVERYDPLTLLPLQTSPTLASLSNPTDQQILSIITGDNPNGAFQTVAKYSSNPLAADTSKQIVSFLQPTLNLDRSSTLNSPLPTNNPGDSLLETQTSSNLTLEQLSRVESTAVNLWQNLLPDHRQLEVNFQITDLANGEIAQAQVTKFSPTGLAIGGTILIDRTAQGAGWFVDSTPLDWSEFTPFSGGTLQAKPDSAASGKYDLFTALLHELGHISGFGHGDTSKQLANLTQKFLIPANATKLQFTIKDAQLGIRPNNASPAPNDSFEVALLDAQTLNPLAGTAQGLTNTDSLLNLQADGTVYFSDKVQIGGATMSGGAIGTTGERTVTIDLTGIASNTEAMLYFDLLSFSSGASHVTIDTALLLVTRYSNSN